MKTITLLIAACLAMATSMTCFTGTALADDHRGTHVVLGQNAGTTSYSATITTGGRGVWINVHARLSYSGQYASPSGATIAYASYGSRPGSSSNGSSAGYSGSASVGRSWTNAQGEPYYEVGGRVYHLAGVNIGWESEGASGWFTVGSRQHPGEVPEALYVNGQFQGIVWVPVGAGNVHWGAPPSGQAAGTAAAPVVVDPRVVAMNVLQHIPLPNVQLRMNPHLGLVAMPGWFWGEGYNGQPFGGSASVGAVTVAVQVEAVSYTWSFGDGATVVSHDLGQPYPAESDIKHTYQYSSLHFPDGFPIRLTIEFAATYSVNGGPLIPLSTMARTYTASYRVQEVQSILTTQ